MEEVERIKVNTMIIVVRSDDIVEILENKDWDQPDSLEIIKEDTSMIKKSIGGHLNRALLVEVPSKYADKEILKHYQSIEMGAVARALLLNSFATKIVGNLFLKISKGKPNEAGRLVPLKLFTKKEEAVKWLLDHMEAQKK